MLKEEYLKLINEFISFKTVSALSGQEDEFTKACNWLSELLVNNGFRVSIWPSTKGNPIVFSEYLVNPEYPTWLVYGHYDVQPAENQIGWESHPFSSLNRDGRIFGRGAMDNKGQILIHLVAIFELIRKGELKQNIKFVIEGNEETGSDALVAMLAEHKTELACNKILISDGDIIGNNPVIEVGFRGISNTTLTYKTASNVVHSGEYSNAIPNAAHELSKLIAGIFGDNDEIQIKNFNAGVPSERIPEIPIDFEVSKTRLGHKKNFISVAKNYHETIGLYPSISVVGFKSGYIEEGYANIIPNIAEAKFSIRIGQGQDPDAVMKLFAAHIAEHTPDYVTAELELTSSIKAEKLNLDDPKLKEIAALLEDIYKDNIVYKYVGGTLPIIGEFRKTLGVEPYSIPLANEDSNMHGANENFSLENIEKGLEFSSRLFGN